MVPIYHEPVKGWSNNIYGSNGIMIGAALGLLRVLSCNESLNANIVPGDMTVNSLIASAWDVAERFGLKNGSFHFPVYNYESWSHKVNFI